MIMKKKNIKTLKYDKPKLINEINNVSHIPGHKQLIYKFDSVNGEFIIDVLPLDEVDKEFNYKLSYFFSKMISSLQTINL